MEGKDKGVMARKEAKGMEELIKTCLRSMKLASGLNRQKVFDAWYEVTGTAAYTVSLFYRNGILYCTMSSSVVRNRLHFMKDDIRYQINRKLAVDELFTCYGSDKDYVKDIVIR